MRKSLFAVAGIVGIVLLAGASPAKADTATVRIPFPFVVGTTIMPAGAYTIHTPSDDPSVVSIISTDGTRALDVVTQWGGTAWFHSKPRFEFKEYGTTHFLAEIRLPDEDGRQIPLPKREIEQGLEKMAMMRHARASRG